MSGPRSFKVFKNNVFYREFSSQRTLAEFMVKNHFPHLKVCSMSLYILGYPKDGVRNYHGFTFEGDPSWVSEKATRAINDETGDIIETKSVAEMGRKFYGNMDNCATTKVSRFIKSGEKFRGYRFEDISVGFVGKLSCDITTRKIPIIGVHLFTGNVILCRSITDASRYVMEEQRIGETLINTVSTAIKRAADGYMDRINEIYGYRWSYPE